ncbi:hypothetical protein QT971_25825 [Microcoleus sp. herbarium19]|uniref:hypothetical protein n=1 Tax=unclassified Microcoleus TaxID=2642155 RepID=UPI002FD5E86A
MAVFSKTSRAIALLDSPARAIGEETEFFHRCSPHLDAAVKNGQDACSATIMGDV